MKHCEKDFQRELIRVAPLNKCEFIEIPDVIPIRRDGFIPKAKKRPCDGILATPTGNYFIECKYGKNVLLPHQKVNMQKINKINNSYYVVRKRIVVDKDE